MDYNNLIIELRQKKASGVFNNGDFNTTLSKCIEIRENDEIIINKAFVDTQAQTDQKIIIEEEYGQIMLRLETYLYHTNNDETDKVYSDPATLNDGMDYIWCNSTAAGDVPAGYHTITQLEIVYDDNIPGRNKSGGWGDSTNGQFPVLLNYIDMNGAPALYPVEIPFQKIYPKVPDSFQSFVAVEITCKDGSINMNTTNPNNNWLKNRALLNPNIPAGHSKTPTDSVLTPYKFASYVYLDAGSYLPEDICNKVNNTLTTNNNFNSYFSVDNIVNSGFLKHSGQQKNTPATALDQFCRVDGEKIFRFDTSPKADGSARPKYWFGASLIELAWDTDSNMFFWKYIHQPNYNGTTGAIVSNMGQDKATNLFFHSGKNGGVIFSQLDAMVSDQTSKHFGNGDTQYDFWDAKLGFNVNHIIRGFNQTTPAKAIGSGLFHTISIKNHGNGFDTTSARPNLDSIIQKSSFKTVIGDPTTLSSTNDLTTEIYAEKSVLNSLVLDYGFYYVELQAGFQTEIIAGDTTTKNISGILNRYYSLGAYTSGGQESGIVYQHKGETLYLRDVRVRILDSDRNLANKIGEDNSVFIQIIRGNPNQTTDTNKIKQTQEKEQIKQQKFNNK